MKAKPTFKLEHWLALGFFGLNLIFTVIIFISVYVQMRSSLLERTRNQLRSINLLKEKLVQSYLHDKVSEASHTISYFRRHAEVDSDLKERLTVIEDVREAYVKKPSSENSFPALVDSLFQLSLGNDLYLGTLPVGFGADSASFFICLNDTAFSVLLLFSMQGIQNVLMERSGMGATGESYLVGPDRKLLTLSRFLPNQQPSTIQAKTTGVTEALAGQAGILIYPDYRNVMIIGAYRPVRFQNINWALLTEIDLSEAMSPVYAIRDQFIGLLILLMLVSLAISLFLSKQLSRPILALREKILRLSQGVLPPTQSQSHLMIELVQITDAINRLIKALRRTAVFAEQIGEGNLSVDYVPLSNKDELGHSILRMREQLLKLNQEKNALERETKKNLLNAQEAERERIARDIHDGIGPLLTTVRLKINAMQQPVHLKQELLELIDSTLNELRSVSRNLMPAVLMDFGPGEALAMLVDDLRKNTNITFHYLNELETVNSNLEKEIGIAVYRICQEALNNAVKHARATVIQLTVTEFEDHIDLFIRDNGRGFDPTVSTKGSGLRNISERVSILGGDIAVNSGPSGTVIEIELPLPNDKNNFS